MSQEKTQESNDSIIVEYSNSLDITKFPSDVYTDFSVNCKDECSQQSEVLDIDESDKVFDLRGLNETIEGSDLSDADESFEKHEAEGSHEPEEADEVQGANLDDPDNDDLLSVSQQEIESEDDEECSITKRAKDRFFGVASERNRVRNAAKKRRREENGYIFFKNRKARRGLDPRAGWEMVPIEPYEDDYKVPAELNLCEPATCRCEHETREPIAQCEGSSLQITPKNPGPYENGEYEVDHLSVVTRNHKLFRLHCKGWDADPTVEPLTHLTNAPTKVEEAIKAYESRPGKYKYRGKRATE